MLMAIRFLMTYLSGGYYYIGTCQSACESLAMPHLPVPRNGYNTQQHQKEVAVTQKENGASRNPVRPSRVLLWFRRCIIQYCRLRASRYLTLEEVIRLTVKMDF